MAIDAARWPLVKAHFAALADLPDEARASALAQLEDAELRTEVRALLNAAALVGERFERAPSLPGPGDGSAVVAARAPTPGDRIGRWVLGDRLGEGGMGTVFAATRDDAGFTQLAALKLVTRTTPMLVARFRAERRILAQLQHPHIAALLDGGVTEDGRPWAALERVDGVRLDRHPADLRTRVRLMQQVCAAVQYAHERLVVHRDLKPANILVTADGTVKLLDFGIARLLSDDDDTLTQPGAAPMTAAYASPEQRAGAPVTTASDIYALGVVLHELLTGLRPRRDPRTDAVTMPPSRRVVTASDDETDRIPAPDAAGRRRLAAQVNGELDAIVLMALRPEPDRRYRSVAALADDLQRWLDGRPVTARPDTAGYRLAKLVQRNPFATAALAAGVVALLAGTAVSVAQAERARLERDRARQAQQRTAQVTRFFAAVLAPAGQPAATVFEAIERAAPALDTAFAGQPDLRAALQLTVGSTLQNLGLQERARPLLTAAYAHFRRTDTLPPQRDLSDALYDLAVLARHDGRWDDAEQLYRDAMAIYLRWPQHYPQTDVLETQMAIASMRGDQGDLAGAIAVFDSVLPQFRPRTRADSLTLANRIGTRATMLLTLGRFDRAPADLLNAVRIHEGVEGPVSYATGNALQPYAGALLFQGRLDSAEAVARRSVAVLSQSVGAHTTAVHASARLLATVLIAQDRCPAARPVLDTIIADRGTVLSEADPSLAYALVHRGYCRARLGEVAAGIADAREGDRLFAAILPDGHYMRAMSRSLRGAALGYGGPALRAAAEADLVAGVAGLRATLDSTHPRIRDAEARLAEFRQRTRGS